MCERMDISTRAAYAYLLCGWHTRSDIPLTRMPTVVGDGERADVIIQIAPGESPIAKSPDRSDWARFDHSTDGAVGLVIGRESQVQRGGLGGLSGDSEPPGAVFEKALDEGCFNAQSESLVAIRVV